MLAPGEEIGVCFLINTVGEVHTCKDFLHVFVPFSPVSELPAKAVTVIAGTPIPSYAFTQSSIPCELNTPFIDCHTYISGTPDSVQKIR